MGFIARAHIAQPSLARIFIFGPFFCLARSRSSRSTYWLEHDRLPKCTYAQYRPIIGAGCPPHKPQGSRNDAPGTLFTRYKYTKSAPPLTGRAGGPWCTPGKARGARPGSWPSSCAAPRCRWRGALGRRHSLPSAFHRTRHLLKPLPPKEEVANGDVKPIL